MAVNQQQMTSSRYIGALLAVGVYIPIPLLAMVLTLLSYFWLSSLSAPTFVITLLPLLGLILTIIVWLLLALFFLPLATAEGGKLSDYEIFQGDLNVLKAQFEIIQATQNQVAPGAAQDQARQTAIVEIQNNLAYIDTMLKRNGLTWVLRTGYISLWDRMNKADEAMIVFMPPQRVIEGAKYDELRLKGSQVPDNKDLIEQLKRATCTLSSDPTDSQKQEANSNIRQVRSALHKYTNERWDALVRARNQLLGTAVLTSVLTYILVDVAILVGVPVVTLEQISGFYLLGAIVGLFGRMLNESNTKDADIAHMDDYGLTGVRILVTPLLSGLAALVGVLLASMLSIVLTTTVSHSTMNLPTLANIYNFNMYPQNLVFAAVFGYLPSLVIGLLKQQANKIQSEIHSSSPAD